MYEPIVDTTGPFMEVLLVDMAAFEVSILAYRLCMLYSSLHRTQSGETCSMDKNNQPSGSVGNDSKIPNILST